MRNAIKPHKPTLTRGFAGMMRVVALLIDASELLRKLLQEQHLTQAEFAQLAGVTVATVNRWVNGHSLADGRKVAAAFTAMGLDPREHGINTPTPSMNNKQLEQLVATLAENQRLQHEELLAVLVEIRTGIDILRARP